MTLSLRMPWPLPALLAWAGAWLLFVVLQRVHVPPAAALLAACLLATAASLLGGTWWRRGLIAAGFPLSLALLGGASVPTWAWLLPLGLLLLVYPLNAWRDAPVFPTPRDALLTLPAQAPIAASARVLDAGCGMGDGLRALRAAYPAAQLEGVEWSWPLRLLSAVRCPWARVRRGDLWQQSWSSFSLVYLFQRPESLPRAVAKASAELAPGDWLASLEFPAVELVPQGIGRAEDGRPVWLYRHPFVRSVPAPDADTLRRLGSSRPPRGR